MAAWSPWTQADTQCLEAVQQRAVRVISSLRASTYEDKLRELGMPSLQERRNEIDMVLTYKIVIGVDMVVREGGQQAADQEQRC